MYAIEQFDSVVLEKKVVSFKDFIGSWPSVVEIATAQTAADIVYVFAPLAPNAFKIAKVEGFNFICTRATFARDNGVMLAEKDHTSFVIFEATVETMPPFDAMRSIVFSVGRSGRYMRDEEMGEEAMQKIYAQWYVNSLTRGKLFVATISGKPVGFHSTRRTGQTLYTDLIGVDPTTRGLGVGSELLMMGIKGERECRVITEIENGSAVRFYEAHGYRQSRVQAVFHWHRG